MITIKFNNRSFIMSEDVVDNWSEVTAYITVQKEKEKAIKHKLADTILRYRDGIKEMINLTDDELYEIIKLNDSNIDYSNFGMSKTKGSPFKFKK